MIAVKPILFCDFDGVLCHSRYWRSLVDHEQEQIQSLLFRDDTTLVSNWMRGLHSAEEINEIVSERTGIPFERLWATFVVDCQMMEVSAEALETIGRLRRRYTVILITGNTDSFNRFTVPAQCLDVHFDLISNSFDERQSKTDHGGELFQRYADRFGVSMRDCVVLDDSPLVCEVFRALGGTAYLVTEDNDVVDHLKHLDRGAR